MSSFPTFSRLVAAAYYTRHRSAFNVSLPDLFALLSTATSNSQLSQHLFFMDELRKIIWPRTSSQEECLPSSSALQLHWSRCCWVLRVWSQACSSSLDVPAPTEHGWCVNTTGKIEVSWDTEESIASVKALVESLTSGCKCKTGCSTNRCKCRKSGDYCSVGCRCKDNRPNCKKICNNVSEKSVTTYCSPCIDGDNKKTVTKSEQK